MNWTWKHARAAYAVIALLLWLLLYGLYWRARSHPQLEIGDALINWIGDVVMLQWVDTTLAAGLLALAGAALVLVAALYQRRTALIDAAELNRTTLLALLGLTSLRAQKLLALLWEDKGLEAAAFIDGFDKDLSQLVSRAPGLAHWLQQVTTEIDSYLEDVPGRENRNAFQQVLRRAPNRWKALAYATVMVEFLNGYERLVQPTGAYKHMAGSRSAVTRRIGTLSDFGLDDLRLAKGMFE